MGVTILFGETAFFLGDIPSFKHASRCFWWYHVYSAIQQIKIGTLVILTKNIHHNDPPYPNNMLSTISNFMVEAMLTQDTAIQINSTWPGTQYVHQETPITQPGYVNSLSYWKWWFGGLVRGFTHSMVDLSICKRLPGRVDFTSRDFTNENLENPTCPRK